MNLTLTKQFAVTIQSSKPFRNLKLCRDSEHLYLISRRQRVSEVSSSGKLRKILIPRKESKILASGVSECATLIAGLTSSGQVIICSKQKKIFQSFLLPPQIKLSIEILKPEHCSLYIFSKGLILIGPNDQVWLWKADDDLKDPENLSPHLKGVWINLNSSSLLKVRSEVGSWRSNVSESRPSSNSSRPAGLKSRYTTHSFTTRASWDYLRGRVLGVLRIWLRSINEDSCIMESRFLFVNLTDSNKAGNTSTSIASIDEFVYKGTLEFWSKKGQKDMGLVSKLDHSCSIAAIGVNSSHPYFCQLVFLHPMTGMCTTRKLCNYVTVDDIPNTSNDGQTSFWIDDICWSPDDSFVALAFKSGFISIFNRIGEPLPFILDMRSSKCETRIFSHAFFTTDPDLIKKSGSFLSIDWTANEVIISDGYSICELCISKYPSLKELIPTIMPADHEAPDISINISHETNPIPSEIDSGPKRKNIEQAFLLLRSCWSNCHAVQNKEAIFSITNWIANVLPPQLHEEINYTALPNARFETESRLANGLILKKKVHAIDIYRQFCQIIEMENWSIVHNSDSQEWVLSIAYQVFKYMLADQQALYAWNTLKLFERWAGFKLQRIRNMLVIYSLIQYRNHQANHINVVYFLIAYAAVRGNSQHSLPVLSQEEEEFLRQFIKSNIEPVQDGRSPNGPAGLNSFYYLAMRNKEKVDSSLNYLLGYSNSFNDVYQEICCQLLKSNLKYIDSYLSTESLILFAYFFDNTENLFISPIEATSVFSQNYLNIADLYENLKKLSQVPCTKDKKLQKDSAFLYWTLRMFSKLEILLPVDQAFYSINKLIPYLNEADIPKALLILKRLFSKENSLKLLDLCIKDLKPYFQQYTLELLRDKLKYFSTHLNENLNEGKPDICGQVYEKLVSDALSDHLALFKTSVGEIQVKKDKTENWLDLEFSNFNNCSGTVLLSIHEIFKYFWFLYVQEQVIKQKTIDWVLRLVPLYDLSDRNLNLERILNEDLEFTSESRNIIALYLRASMFTGNLSERLLLWKDKIKSKSESSHIFHSLEQPAYLNPWIFDSEFLNFSEKIAGIKIVGPLGMETASKSWNSTVKVLTKQYKVNGFYKYVKGVYSEIRENTDLDLSGFEYLFSDSIHIVLNQEVKPETNLNLPFSMTKNRLKLEVIEKIPSTHKNYTVQELIATKKLANILKVSFKRVFIAMKPLKKIQNPEFLNQKKIKEGFFFFTVKKEETELKEGNKGLPLKFVNSLDTHQKAAKHRRIQSVVLPSVSIQKPFHIIRVLRSHA